MSLDTSESRGASSHIAYINMSSTNCAAQNYFREENRHDQVNHMGLDISDMDWKNTTSVSVKVLQ